MAFLDSNGLKILTEKISEKYTTQENFSSGMSKLTAEVGELSAKIQQCAKGLSAADEKFFLASEAENFVEKYQLADFVENSALENFLTVADAENFATKSELEEVSARFEDYPTNADLSTSFANFVTFTVVDEKLKPYAKIDDVEANLENYATHDELNAKFSTCAQSSAVAQTLQDYAKISSVDALLENYATHEDLTAATENFVTSSEVDEKLKPFAKTADVDSIFDDYDTAAQIDEKIKNFVTTEAVDKILEVYSTTAELNSKLQDYLTDENLQPYAKVSDVEKILEDYPTTAQANSQLENFATLDTLDEKIRPLATTQAVDPILEAYPTNENLAAFGDSLAEIYVTKTDFTGEVAALVSQSSFETFTAAVEENYLRKDDVENLSVSSAEKLTTARKIYAAGDVSGNVTFDGSKDVIFNLSVTNANYAVRAGNASVADNCSTATTAVSASKCTGNAATASKLQSARKITLTGDVAAEGTFDGSENFSLSVSVDSAFVKKSELESYALKSELPEFIFVLEDGNLILTTASGKSYKFVGEEV